MNDQVFRGRTLAEARLAAFQKLGPAAVVLTTRSVARGGIGGWFGASDVEIAARLPAALRAGSPVAPSDVPFAEGAYAERAARTPGSELAALRAELKADIRAMKTLLTETNGSASLAGEIEHLRGLIEGLTGSKSSRDKVTARLRAIGIEGAAATALARALRGKTAECDGIRDELLRVLRVAPWPLDGQRVAIALVGPSGVGKTTTAAKLAARARIEGQTVTLVACDTFRVGAVEQLAAYAELVGADLATAGTSDELRALLEGTRSDVVIVDTQGKPPTADGVEIALVPPRQTRSARSRARHVLLCLPAALRFNDATRAAKQYGALAPTSLAITKIDETDAPAGIVHASWASKLAVSVTCFGQRVPEDISPTTIGALVDYVAPPPSKAKTS